MTDSYLSDAFKARSMPNKKIRRTREAPDMSDLPLFNGAIREHEETQELSQQALTPTPTSTQGD